MGMVSGADSFKKRETGVPPLLFIFFLYIFLIWLCKNVVKWDGSGRGRLRPVQNDRTGFLEVLEWVQTNNSFEKTMKNIIFHDFLVVWGLALGSFVDN